MTRVKSNLIEARRPRDSFSTRHSMGAAVSSKVAWLMKKGLRQQLQVASRWHSPAGRAADPQPVAEKSSPQKDRRGTHRVQDWNWNKTRAKILDSCRNLESITPQSRSPALLTSFSSIANVLATVAFLPSWRGREQEVKVWIRHAAKRSISPGHEEGPYPLNRVETVPQDPQDNLAHVVIMWGSHRHFRFFFFFFPAT